MEKLNKQVKTEANQNLADFSWVEDEIKRIANLEIRTDQKLARLDFWNKEKGFGFMYVDEDNNPCSKEKDGSKKVFVHASSIYELKRGQEVTDIYFSDIEETPKGLSIRRGQTVEIFDIENTKKLQEMKNVQLKESFLKVHKQNIKLWQEKISSKVIEDIQSKQEPFYSTEQAFCPHCDSNLGNRPLFDISCTNCDWTYSYYLTTKLDQVNFLGSEDDMRGGGHYDVRRTEKIETGTPPKIVSEYSNAAMQIKRNGDFSIKISEMHIPRLSPLAKDFEENVTRLVEYSRLSDYFPEIPKDLEPDELYKWAKENAIKIIEDYETRIRKIIQGK